MSENVTVGEALGHIGKCSYLLKELFGRSAVPGASSRSSFEDVVSGRGSELRRTKAGLIGRSSGGCYLRIVTDDSVDKQQKEGQSFEFRDLCFSKSSPSEAHKFMHFFKMRKLQLLP